jgi:hypothetical protein
VIEEELGHNVKKNIQQDFCREAEDSKQSSIICKRVNENGNKVIKRIYVYE